MSSYFAPAIHPVRKTVELADFLDDYFGRHQYGVRFDNDGRIWRENEVELPTQKPGGEDAPS